MALANKLCNDDSADQLQLLLNDHLKHLAVRGYSEYTLQNRRVHIGFFLRWCRQCGMTAIGQINANELHRYQEYTFDYRKPNGEPLAAQSRNARLVPLRVWLRWMAKQHLVPESLASEIELPRLGRPLPRNILSAREVERVLAQPDLRTPLGLRDRAIMETLYSAGIRRLELVRLKLPDLHLDRGLVFVREGKGKRDRYVPIGRRAAGWLERYLRDARPALLSRGTDTVVIRQNASA